MAESERGGASMGGDAGVDLTACDREPIHIPGSIQPHGTLLTLDIAGRVVAQAAANAAEWLGRPEGGVIGAGLDDLFGADQGSVIAAGLAGASLEKEPLYLGTFRVAVDGRWRASHAIAHRVDGLAVIELEASPNDRAASFHGLYPLIRSFLARLPEAAGSGELTRLAAEQVRRTTGFDRVLIYRFELDGGGVVVAEDGNGVLPSYLGLHFPESDIPKQARELYRVNRIRLIADADDAPVPVVPAEHPATGRPLDMSFATLRSIAPVHVEYMKNMGTAASMSISILRRGALWGLISCHNATAKVAPFEVRTACDMLGQLLASHLDVQEHTERFESRMRLKSIETRLLRAMAAEESFADGLVASPADLLAFGSAAGAAVVVDGRVLTVGQVPAPEQIHRLVDWLAGEAGGEDFHTDSLSARFAPAAAYAGEASGVLAVSISKLYRSFVLWFRPEVVRAVEWGGDPRKPAEPVDGESRLSPRKSFERWKETVRGRSSPWDEAEVAAAAELRGAIVGIVLRKAEELAALSDELKRSNRELEAFSYSVSHDLRAPLRHVVGYGELLADSLQGRMTAEDRRYLDTIVDAARLAGSLVDNLLRFAQVGRSEILPAWVEMDALVEEVRREVIADAPGRILTWSIGPLPRVRGDLMLLRQVVRNLLSNAVKFTGRPGPARIEVDCTSDEREHVFRVADDGVGFDMAYVDKLFGVFQRLHRFEDYEGTGIGLANARRIVERHRGRIWAEGEVDRGATFSFTIPREST